MVFAMSLSFSSLRTFSINRAENKNNLIKFHVILMILIEFEINDLILLIILIYMQLDLCKENGFYYDMSYEQTVIQKKLSK